MSGRRDFLKQAGALAAAAWLPPAANPKLSWAYSDGRVHVELDGRRIASSFAPGYQKSGSWQPCEALAAPGNSRPYTDRCGRGSSVSLQCRLGGVDGALQLVTYD